MAMIGDTIPTTKGIKDLKTAKEGYEKAHQDYLKGRTLKKAEDDIAKSLEDAENAAEKLKLATEERIKQAVLKEKSAESVTNAANALMAETDKKAKSLVVEQKALNEAQAELVAMVEAADKKAQNAAKIKQKAQDKINAVNALLKEVLDI